MKVIFKKLADVGQGALRSLVAESWGSAGAGVVLERG